MDARVARDAHVVFVLLRGAVGVRRAYFLLVILALLVAVGVRIAAARDPLRGAELEERLFALFVWNLSRQSQSSRRE